MCVANHAEGTSPIDLLAHPASTPFPLDPNFHHHRSVFIHPDSETTLLRISSHSLIQSFSLCSVTNQQLDYSRCLDNLPSSLSLATFILHRSSNLPRVILNFTPRRLTTDESSRFCLFILAYCPSSVQGYVEYNTVKSTLLLPSPQLLTNTM